MGERIENVRRNVGKGLVICSTGLIGFDCYSELFMDKSPLVSGTCIVLATGSICLSGKLLRMVEPKNKQKKLEK